MQIEQATRKFEKWMARHTPLVANDLVTKHSLMRADLFSFFRATFYRWMQLWPEVCPELAGAPALLAVGDLHLENFGTWRDQEGRLVWGVNDFDEAAPLPYTADLVRLAASALLAGAADRLALSPKATCEAILEGYQHGLKVAAEPFVLSGPHSWMRVLVEGGLRDPASFWQSLNEQPAVAGQIPADAAAAIAETLPERGLAYRVVTRTKGLGSLGRPRFIGLAVWKGGTVAREIKALIPSASNWAAGAEGKSKIHYAAIVGRAVRCPDPFLAVRENWIIRRLAPDCIRIDLGALAKSLDEARLLRTMGRETANIHQGTPDALKDIRRDLKKRPAKWLWLAAREMVRAITKDWHRWKLTEPLTPVIKPEDATVRGNE